MTGHISVNKEDVDEAFLNMFIGGGLVTAEDIREALGYGCLLEIQIYLNEWRQLPVTQTSTCTEASTALLLLDFDFLP